MRYEFLPQAREELDLAFNRYEDISQNLGYDLISETEIVLARLIEFPKSSPPVTKRHRKAVLNRFPYTIIYSINENTILVTAFMHQSRKPGYWKNRI